VTGALLGYHQREVLADPDPGSNPDEPIQVPHPRKQTKETSSIMQVIPNIGWLRGGDYSAWF